MFSRSQMDYVVQTWVDHYLHERPHRGKGIGNRVLDSERPAPDSKGSMLPRPARRTHQVVLSRGGMTFSRLGRIHYRASAGSVRASCSCGATVHYGRGFARTNVAQMRAVYLPWEIVQTPSGQFEARAKCSSTVVHMARGARHPVRRNTADHPVRDSSARDFRCLG